MEYPPVGSEWKDGDLRVKGTVRVVRYDVERRRVRIHCIKTDILSWAKPERFNGKSGGYSKIETARGKHSEHELSIEGSIRLANRGHPKASPADNASLNLARWVAGEYRAGEPNLNRLSDRLVRRRGLLYQ